MTARLTAELSRAQGPATAPTVIAAGVTMEDWGKLLLRLSLGGMLLLHGIGKLQGGIDQIIAAVAATGLPPALAYLVFVGEVVAPALLVVGLWTRMAAGVVVINMVVAIALVHSHEIDALSRSGGWAIELQAFYLLTAVALALLGAGRLAMDSTERPRS